MLVFFERLAGVLTEPDLEVRRQGRALVSLALVGGALGVGHALVYLLVGAWGDSLIAIASALGTPVLVMVWRSTRNQGAVLAFGISWYLTIFLGAAVATQALAYVAWAAVLPAVAFLNGGLERGLRWTGVIVLGVALTAMVLLLFPFDFGIPGTPLVRLLRVVTLPPTLGAVGYLFELARQKNAHELDEARRVAEHASHAKSRLLAQVSHEIRTPLNGVLGLTQSLLHQPLPAGAHADLLLIQRSGNGLLSLINDLLDVARAESGKLELHPGPVELGQLLRDVTALYRETATARTISLSCDGDSETCWVLTDEVRLRQVIANLVANALKFTESGSVIVRLVRGREASGQLEVAITVEDTGRGMAAEDLERLFEPFTQVHDDVAHEGSGLGLAISQELATQLGGQLSVASTRGHGSVFTLMLSLATTSAPSALVPRLERLTAFRALVVDDNAINLRVALALLERLGATVETAAGGEVAITKALEEPFDVVLMDLQMPAVDGFEATRRLRAAGLTLPIIALTASAGPQTRQECLGSGMNECLTKPLQLERLGEVLAAVLRPGAAASPPEERPPRQSTGSGSIAAL